MTNQLDYAKVIKLSKWIDANLSTFSVQTKNQVAKLASEACGFPVTNHNLENIIVQMDLDVAFRKEVTKRKADPKIKKQITSLRDAVILLYERCGEPFPPDLNVENW